MTALVNTILSIFKEPFGFQTHNSTLCQLAALVFKNGLCRDKVIPRGKCAVMKELYRFILESKMGFVTLRRQAKANLRSHQHPESLQKSTSVLWLHGLTFKIHELGGWDLTSLFPSCSGWMELGVTCSSGRCPCSGRGFGTG